MAYPKVHIVNSTNYTVKGTVKYAACSSDDFEIAPWGSWTAGSRGVCLLTKITANVKLRKQIPTHHPVHLTASLQFFKKQMDLR